MLKKDIFPANQEFENTLKDGVMLSRQLDIYDPSSYEVKTLNRIRKLKKDILKDMELIERSLRQLPDDALKRSFFYHDKIIPLMDSIRKNCDELELISDRQYWPMPTYKELLFGVD